MFPTTPISYFLGEFLTKGPKTAESFKEDPDIEGLVWEIPLEDSREEQFDKIRELGIWYFGPKERKVTILALPNSGTEDELTHNLFNLTAFSIGRVVYDEVLTDLHLKKIQEQLGCSGSGLLQSIKAKNTLMKMASGISCSENDFIPRLHIIANKRYQAMLRKILENPEKKQKFLSLGEQIFERVRHQADKYINEIPDIFGILMQKKSLKDELDRIDFANLQTDENKIEFYLSLSIFLEQSYRHQSGSGSPSMNLKEVFLESISMSLNALSIASSKNENLVKSIMDNYQELSQIDNPTLQQTRLTEVTSAGSSSQIGREIKIESILPEREAKVKTAISSVQETIDPADLDSAISKHLGLMHRMLRDDTEQDLIKELGLWKKAWVSGDIKTLRRFRGSILELEYSGEEIEKVSSRVLQSINTNSSSLYILPLSAVTGNVNLVDALRQKGVNPVQIVRKKPETPDVQGFFYKISSQNGEEVGSLLGTIHVANKNMLRLNLSMIEAIEKADRIYLEMKPSNSIPNMQLSFPQNLTPAEIVKIQGYVDLVFPVLLKKIEEEGVSIQVVNSLKGNFQYGNLEKKFVLVITLLDRLSLHHKKIVHKEDFLAQIPVGIDHLLVDLAMTNQKEILGLEEASPSRFALFNEFNQWNNLSTKAIQSFPSTEAEVEQYIATKISEVADLCDAWVVGDEAYVKNWGDNFKANPSLHAKFLPERDAEMAHNIHEALVQRKPGDLPFFAVGAAHVVGSGENVVCHLQRQGWKVERI